MFGASSWQQDRPEHSAPITRRPNRDCGHVGLHVKQLACGVRDLLKKTL